VPDLELSKVANLFVPNATTPSHMTGPVKGAVSNYGMRHGGLWVGGRIHLRDGRIWFNANALNRALHTGLGGQGVTLADVVAVEVRPGVLTKIVDVITDDDLLRFRCFRAAATAEAIRRAVKQARGSSGT
jgi:hypothetical protein